jgi:hypothetical protein
MKEQPAMTAAVTKKPPTIIGLTIGRMIQRLIAVSIFSLQEEQKKP